MESKVVDLGLIDYSDFLKAQQKIFQQVKSEKIKSVLILCRHYPVITLGRLAKKENILISEEELSLRSIKICRTERGGDVTYHGPGQLMVYPILNLNYFKKDIHWYLRSLEQYAIELLDGFGVKARTRPGLTGAWVNDKKIASIGIAIKNWITFHGLAINVKHEDLVNFHLIRPCGMDIMMTSVEDILQREIEICTIKEKGQFYFSKWANIAA
ncbi:MAG: lipoyl(octanoyl) transferase LipB [Candidatus Omnitrophota bacterium]